MNQLDTHYERDSYELDWYKEWEAEGGWERVVAWVMNLTIGQVFIRALENPRVYHDDNKAYPKNFWWSILFSKRHNFSSIPQTNDLPLKILRIYFSRNQNWAGCYSRVSNESYFSTVTCDPHPERKQGRVLHPDPKQKRVFSVRELARPQYYKTFCGSNFRMSLVS